MSDAPDKRLVQVSVELLQAVEHSLGAFCSDEGWGQADMDTLDRVSAVLARNAATPWPPTPK